MILIFFYSSKTICLYGNLMKSQEKYYIECNLDLIIEASEQNREQIMKKLNGIISSALKNEKVMHVSRNINLISETDIFLSMARESLADLN